MDREGGNSADGGVEYGEEGELEDVAELEEVAEVPPREELLLWTTTVKVDVRSSPYLKRVGQGLKVQKLFLSC